MIPDSYQLVSQVKRIGANDAFPQFQISVHKMVYLSELYYLIHFMNIIILRLNRFNKKLKL